MKKGRGMGMKGRKISLEDRGPDAPKLGRPYTISDKTVRKVISLTLPEHVLKELEKEADDGISGYIRDLLISRFSD